MRTCLHACVDTCILLHVGLEKIESLQSHVNESIYKLAYKLIDTHFDVEDNDENVVPDQSHEQYVFAPKANLPPGGFQF